MKTFFFSNKLTNKQKQKKNNQNNKKNNEKIKLFSNKIVNSDKNLFIRFYFETIEDSKKLIHLEEKSIELFLFIQENIEQSFVLNSANINTYYSTEDNQIRVIVNYKDDNIKRIFINTCSNLFSNLKYFLEREKNFFTIFESFFLSKITITGNEETKIYSIFENDKYFEKKEDIIPDEKEKDLIYDYVIIGGGPGSIMTAYKLSINNNNKKILLLEDNKNSFQDYTSSNYTNTTKWWEANNDMKFKDSYLDSDGKVISLGKGLGGGTLHFGLQYIDHYDLVNLNYGDWYNDFVELSNILKPQTYSYSSENGTMLPTKSHFEMLSELSSNNNIKTYNNKIYSSNTKEKTRILLGTLIDKLPNVTIKYNNKVNKLFFDDKKVTSCNNFNNETFYGKKFILGAGAINTPAILQRSGYNNCGNQIFDHGAISIVYKKYNTTNVESTKKIVEGYNDEEIEELSLAVLTLNEIKDMNTSDKMVAIFNHTKLSNEELEKAKNGKFPSYNVKLNDQFNSNIKYVYDMGSWWSGGGHPGGSLIYRMGSDYDLTNVLLSRHGNSYNRLFLGNPPAKLIGIYGEKTTNNIEVLNKVDDLGFDNNNIIPHIQTHDLNHKWQTYYSYIPNLNDTLILTHAQSKNLPKSGSVKIVNDTSANPIVTLNHLGNEKQKELTINYIYDAYKKNNTTLEKLNYKYEGKKITNKYIEQNLNSIYHYHGTCAIGDVVDNNHKVLDTDNVYICDASILPNPWPGSTSVPSGVAGLRTAKHIIENEKKTGIFEWTNKNENSELTIKTVEKALEKWNSIINYNENIFRIKLNFTIKKLDDPLILGYAQITKYYDIKTKTIKEYNNYNYYYDLQNYNLGEVLPSEGEVVFNQTQWEKLLLKKRDDGNSHAYYIALHELGHVLGIGPLWILNGAMLYDQKSETFFYGGENANNEYKKTFPNLNLQYLPLEDNGGPGTAHVHPEEGEEGDISVNDRFYNGVLHPGLNHELMTGFAENTNVPLPLSTITVGMIKDLGYDVNINNSDNYNISYNSNIKVHIDEDIKGKCGSSKTKYMFKNN